MSTHPRYNSRVFSFLSRQIGALRDRSQEVFRYAKMLGQWTIEAATFPFYRAVQERKVLAQKVGNTVATVTGLLGDDQRKRDERKPGSSSSSAILRVVDSISIRSVAPQTTTQTTLKVTLSPNQTTSTWGGKLRKIAKQVKSFFQSPKPLALKSAKAEICHQAQIQPLKNLEIQGVASILESQKLVLVTSEQITLDILSPSQQLALQKRIIWEVASFYFKQRCNARQQKRLGHVKAVLTGISNQGQSLMMPLRQLTGIAESSSVAPEPMLQSLAQKLPELLQNTPLSLRPLLALRPSLEIQDTDPSQPLRLKGLSLQKIPQAITTWFSRNLSPFALKPASDRGGSPPSSTYLATLRQRIAPKTGWIAKAIIGAIASMPLVVIPAIASEQPSPSSLPEEQGVLSSNEQWIDPNHLKSSLSLDELQGMVSQQEQSRTWLTVQRKPQTVENPSLDRPRNTQASHSNIYEGEFGTEVRINAEFMGYETHLLEDILRWLDALMVQVEAVFGTIWHWIGIAVVIVITRTQNIWERVWE